MSLSRHFVTAPYTFTTVSSLSAVKLPSLLVSYQFNFSSFKREVTQLFSLVLKDTAKKDLLLRGNNLDFLEHVQYAIVHFLYF